MTTNEAVNREAVVTVRGGTASMTQRIEARAHRLTADEPLDFGGADTGPTPYELLVSALGT